MNWHIFDLVTVIATKEVGELVQDWNIERMKKILYAYIAYIILAYVTKFLTRNRWGLRTKYTLAKVLWKDIFNKYFWFDISATQKIGTWKMINILSKWAGSRVDMNHIIQYTLSEIVVKLMIVAYLLFQLWRVYTIIFLALFVFLLRLSTWIYDNKVVHLRRKKKNIWVRNTGQMVRMLMSKIEILQINRVQEEIDRYLFWVSQMEQIAYKNMKWVFWMFNSSLIVVHAFFPLIIVYVITSLAQWTFSYGMFVGLSVAAWSLWQFILKTTDAYKKLLDYFIDVEKLRETIDAAPEIHGYYTGDTYSFATGDISIKNIDFAYEDDIVFANFWVNIAWWKKTALVGSSGSGKSTLVKLIAWYLRPDSWSIVVDGQDLKDVSLKSYYKHIWYLTQEPSVFDGTIIDNLTYALDDEVDQEELDKIIRLSKCDFIYDLKDGLNTEIGERGIRLSGGQRQRLAIAKIFLKNPEIIILDEPTSALDSFSEEAITQAMQNLFKDRTVIIIAHRLQTVKNADDIIVLEKWEIIERWTHAELVEAEGFYSQMLELQSGF